MLCILVDIGIFVLCVFIFLCMTVLVDVLKLCYWDVCVRIIKCMVVHFYTMSAVISLSSH